MATQLAQLKQALVGDGWTVVSTNVARHDANAWLPNSQGTVVGIKNIVVQLYQQDQANTKAILIIGHVAVPYSGTVASDGHSCGVEGPDHQGAWAADMYYADVDSTWTDSTANVDNCDYPLNDNFINDGKFDQSHFASAVMKLSIGRIDFARLPIFGTASDDSVSSQEIGLLQNYLTKAHQYRHKELTWQNQSYDKGIVYSSLPFDHREGPGVRLFHSAMQNSSALFGNATGTLVPGDPFLQRTRPYLFGFLAGFGTWSGINLGSGIIHFSEDLLNPNYQPTAAFCVLTGSFMGDWYADNNNFLRSVLTVPNYGLASLWTVGGLWRLDCMGIGEHVGMALVRMVNSPRDTIVSTARDRMREHVVLGDLTLRAHVIATPSNMAYVSDESKITWAGNEPSILGYHVYQATSHNGPFTRISSEIVTSSSFTVPSPPSASNVYMVKAIKMMNLGNGSYRTLSQGAFLPQP